MDFEPSSCTPIDSVAVGPLAEDPNHGNSETTSGLLYEKDGELPEGESSADD